MIWPQGGAQRSSPELPPGSQSCVGSQALYGEEEDNGGGAGESGSAVQTDEAAAERQTWAGQGIQDLHMILYSLYCLVFYHVYMYI